MITPNGRLDYSSSEVYPADTGAWDNTTTWDDFVTWYIAPTLPLTWVTQRLVFETPQDFNLKIETTAQGQVSYEVYVSDTGEFDGEETTVSIAPGDTNIAGFHGLYVMVGVIVDATNGLTRLQDVDISATNKPMSEILTNLDTSVLSGTSSAREIPLTRKYSILSDITINVQEVPAYNMDVYVTDHISCKTVLPRVVSKDRTTPTIALIGLDNVARDATVDIKITGLPEQYMSGNNLLVK